MYKIIIIIIIVIIMNIILILIINLLNQLAYYNLDLIYYSLSDYNNSLNTLINLLKINSNHLSGQLLLAQIYFLLNDYELSIYHYQILLENTKYVNYFILFQL